jgi:hypothetical protein
MRRIPNFCVDGAHDATIGPSQSKVIDRKTIAIATFMAADGSVLRSGDGAPLSDDADIGALMIAAYSRPHVFGQEREHVGFPCVHLQKQE